VPEYFQLPARRLLNRSTGKCLPFQRTINPYRGCELGCVYCYARYTHEFLELDGVRDFETKIFAKQFVASTFRAELAKTNRNEAIAIGTATDPYQPAERRFQVTRQILTVFAAEQGRRLSLTTKSALVGRDLELLGRIARANFLHVNITITTLETKLARQLEPRAPRPDLRLRVVQELAGAGLEVGVFPNPILPLLTDSEGSLDALAAAAARAGASFIGDGLLFLRPPANQVFLTFLEQRFPRLAARYREQFRGRSHLGGEYPKLIQDRVQRIRARHGLAGAPAERPPELWPCDPQLELFPQPTTHSPQPTTCAVIQGL
jgi:DNA repair photolyase